MYGDRFVNLKLLHPGVFPHAAVPSGDKIAARLNCETSDARKTSVIHRLRYLKKIHQNSADDE